MKKTHLLINFLDWMVTIAFVLYMATLIFNISCIVFSDDGHIGNFSSELHPSNGFNIPVEMRVKTPDSIFDFEGGQVATYDSITGNKKYTARKIPSKSSFEDLLDKIDDTHEFIGKNKLVYTTIQVKSSNFLFTTLSIFYSYISIIVTIFILYLLRRILIPLRKEINFTPIIYKNINCIGFTFIISEIVNLLLSIYFIKSYGLIQFKLPTEDSNLSQVIKYSFNPTLDFDFTFLLIGLFLLVLSFLLKKGNEIKEENDLTV